jgi:hypothetical protein
MITSHQQAADVQLRRFASGKKGVAKAVRRFHKRITKFGYEGHVLNQGLTSNFVGCRTSAEVHQVGVMRNTRSG